MERIHSSACVLFRRENGKIKYLLLHYRFSHWGFPKGVIEKEETKKETIKREIKEETGISKFRFIERFKLNIYYFLRQKGKLKFKDVVFYLVETKEKKVKLSFEHIDYKWLNFEDAYKQLTYRNTKKILKRANKFISQYLSSSNL